MLNNWFTIEKIDSTTFAISEYGHQEKVHSYLFVGNEKAALIDTGLGIANIKEEIDKLTDKEIVVITTHNHWDHIGGHGLFKEIAVHEGDREWMEKGLPIPIEQMRRTLMRESFFQEPPKKFNAKSYTPFTGIPQRILRDSDEINLGNRNLEILHTPGHSPGHICIYEATTGYLVTGDILYEGTLYAFFPSTDPILFSESINKLSELTKISKLLPGHNRLNIPVDYLSETKAAFHELENRRQLKHGTGLHRFEHINIRL
jgi:glyoxylase-like metal-dependent hydrolase (beta-lactamase superfamily II)